MADNSFTALAIVTAVAFFVPLVIGLFPKLRLPSVVVEIAAGVVLGPSVLGWVTVNTPVRTLSLLGLASLLFLAGLEIDLRRIRGGPLKRALLGALLSFGLSVGCCYVLAAVGMLTAPLFIAVLLICGAVGLVIPVLKDSGRATTEFGQQVMAGISAAHVGAVVLLALLFSTHAGGAARMVLVISGFTLAAIVVVFVASALGRWQRLTETFVRLQETTAMIRIRGAVFLLVVFVTIAEKLGVGLILGAFVAGVLLAALDPDEGNTHPQFRMRLQAIGFGGFIPVFFVTSGLDLDMRALVSDHAALAAVPVFVLALLVVRAVPAVLYRKVMSWRDVVIAGLLQATSLPFLVAGVSIGLQLGLIRQQIAASLVVAGMLSVLIFLTMASALLRDKRSAVAKSEPALSLK
jgi:Kef-type K+ transport system membrane component KefB